MNKEELTGRIEILLAVFRYTGRNGGLSAGQRICLTMERAACMRAIDLIEQTEAETAYPKYELPMELEKKVAFIYQTAKHMY